MLWIQILSISTSIEGWGKVLGVVCNSDLYSLFLRWCEKRGGTWGYINLFAIYLGIFFVILLADVLAIKDQKDSPIDSLDTPNEDAVRRHSRTKWFYAIFISLTSSYVHKLDAACRQKKWEAFRDRT